MWYTDIDTNVYFDRLWFTDEDRVGFSFTANKRVGFFDFLLV